MLVALPRRRYKGAVLSQRLEVNVPISSMTGFARSQGREGEGSWTWEIKSVNGRGLDIRCRVPPGLESLDVAVRERVAKRLRRGNLQIGLTVKRERTQGSYRVNRDVLDHLLSLVPEVRQRLHDVAPPRIVVFGGELDSMKVLMGRIQEHTRRIAKHREQIQEQHDEFREELRRPSFLRRTTRGEAGFHVHPTPLSMVSIARSG